MKRERAEEYKGHQIEIWKIRRFVPFFGGGRADYDDFVVSVDGESVNQLVMSLGSGPDEWMERARRVVDDYLVKQEKH